MVRRERELVFALALIAAGCRDEKECPPAEPATALDCPAGAAPPMSAPASGSTSASASVAAEAPPGFVRMFPAFVVATEVGAALLLSKDEEPKDDSIVIPIFIGGTEAISIDVRLRKSAFPRPLTHDLMDKTLAALGGKVVQSRIVRLDGTTFIGEIVVARDKETFTIDARPSDAIALAIGNDAEIWVAPEVLKKSGLKRNELEEETPERKPGDPTML